MDPWARLLAVASAIMTSAVLIWASLVAAAQSTAPNDFIPGEITLVMLVMVTIVPLKPWQTFVLGGAIGIEYAVASTVAETRLMEGLGPDENYIIFIVMLTLLSIWITTVVYGHRRLNYDVLHQTIEAGEALRQAQTRILLTETASSLNRLAAAISHEMNTPLGALLSGLDTLLLLAQRYKAATSAQEEARLIEMQAEIRGSIQQSAIRLKELVGKLQRFTDPDQGRMEPANINDIVRGAAAAIEPGKVGAQLHWRLGATPPVTCRPQQLSGVFADLLKNALSAVNGNGRIVVSSRTEVGQVEVEIEDNGRGMSAEEIKTIFEPDLKVTQGRVAAGNWSMFNSRQIVREHGGDIRIASAEGKGTRVTVVLPAAENVLGGV